MAILLAGGQGARLQPYTFTIPKPLLPLGRTPILEVIVGQLAGQGFKQLVVVLGHLPHLFIASLGNGERWDLRIEYVQEPEPLGTAGGLRLVDRLADDFLVMNGDLLTTFDYRTLFAVHRERRATATIGVSRREVKIDYGVLRLSPESLLESYVEKPTLTYEVSMGINVLSRDCLAYIPPSGHFDIPQLMEALRRDGRRVVCYPTDSYWQDIGRLDDYERASADFTADPARFLPTRL